MAKKAKKMSAALANIDREKFYGLEEAVKILKGYEKERKFDQTVDIAINTCLDPRHADQVLRGVTELPNGTGKSVRVAVFARDEKAEEAKAAHWTKHSQKGGCWHGLHPRRSDRAQRRGRVVG